MPSPALLTEERIQIHTADSGRSRGGSVAFRFQIKGNGMAVADQAVVATRVVKPIYYVSSGVSATGEVFLSYRAKAPRGRSIPRDRIVLLRRILADNVEERNTFERLP